jgi:hypothetical protein
MARGKSRRRPLTAHTLPPRNVVELPVWTYLHHGEWPLHSLVLLEEEDAEEYSKFRASPSALRSAPRPGRRRGAGPLHYGYVLHFLKPAVIANVIYWRVNGIAGQSLRKGGFVARIRGKGELTSHWRSETKATRKTVTGMLSDARAEGFVLPGDPRWKPMFMRAYSIMAARAQAAACGAAGAAALKEAFRYYAPVDPNLSQVELPTVDCWDYSPSIRHLARLFVKPSVRGARR